MNKVVNEATLEYKAQKKRMRRTVGSMIFIAFMLMTQGITLHTFFTVKSLLFVILSVAALAAYIYGLVDVARHGVNNARKFKIINGWALIAYIVGLLIIDAIF